MPRFEDEKPWDPSSPEPPTRQQLHAAGVKAKAAVVKAAGALEYAQAQVTFLQAICKPHSYLSGFCETCGFQQPSSSHRGAVGLSGAWVRPDAMNNGGDL